MKLFLFLILIMTLLATIYNYYNQPIRIDSNRWSILQKDYFSIDR